MCCFSRMHTTVIILTVLHGSLRYSLRFGYHGPLGIGSSIICQFHDSTVPHLHIACLPRFVLLFFIIFIELVYKLYDVWKCGDVECYACTLKIFQVPFGDGVPATQNKNMYTARGSSMSIAQISTDGCPMSQTWDKITHSKGEHEHAFPYRNVKQVFDIEPRRCDCGITVDEYIYSPDMVFVSA